MTFYEHHIIGETPVKLRYGTPKYRRTGSGLYVLGMASIPLPLPNIHGQAKGISIIVN